MQSEARKAGMLMSKPSTQIPLSVRQRIYRVLADQFEFDKPIPMATVAFALMDAGIDREAYGFRKLKAFLAELDEFLSFTDIVAGGVPQRLVTVHKRDDWAVEAGGARGAAQIDDAAEGGQAPSGSGGVQPLDPEGAGAGADLGRLASSYASGGIPRGIRDELRPVLSDFVYCPESTLDILRECVPAGTDVRRLLDEDWREAFGSGRLRYYEGKVIFPLRHMRKDGRTPIEVSIRHVTYGNAEEKPWYLCYIDNYVRPERQTRTLIPSHELERFAWLGSWEDFLRELAGLALPEPWDFTEPGSPADVPGAPLLAFAPAVAASAEGQDAGERRYSILKSYICTTFYRLRLEDKVCVDDEAGFAAFNTGLVTRRYDDIFACFEQGAGQAPWRFAGFCSGGARGLGKRVVSLFNPLPEPASYFGRKEDLLYDLERELIIDYDHVLVDNIGRLPLAFLEEELQGDVRASGLLGEVARSTGQRRCELLGEVGRIVQDDPRLFRRLRWRLTEAVDIATKRVRWNFKTAIPSYYPRTNSMNLLLPLCLMEDGVADVALVVQLMPSGNYQGQTILTMRQAYMNARLICRPDSDWLTTASCSVAGSDDEDEDGEGEDQGAADAHGDRDAPGERGERAGDERADRGERAGDERAYRDGRAGGDGRADGDVPAADEGARR